MKQIAFNLRVIEPVDVDDIKGKSRVGRIKFERFVELKHNVGLEFRDRKNQFEYIIIEVPEAVDIIDAKRYVYAELNREYWKEVAEKEYKNLIKKYPELGV